MPPTAPNGCHPQGLGEGDQEGRELCACVGAFEKEKRREIKILTSGLCSSGGCVLAAVCTIFYALGSFSKNSRRAAASSHQQEVLLCVGVIVFH